MRKKGFFLILVRTCCFPQCAFSSGNNDGVLECSCCERSWGSGHTVAVACLFVLLSGTVRLTGLAGCSHPCLLQADPARASEELAVLRYLGSEDSSKSSFQVQSMLLSSRAHKSFPNSVGFQPANR